MSDNSLLIFNSKEYELPDQFKKLVEVSNEIYQKLMKGECKYEVKSKVSEETFKTFVQYLIDGKAIEIHLDTIYELKLLAEEFKISELLEQIETKKNKWRKIEKILEQQQFSSSETNEGKVSIEQQIQQLYKLFDMQRKEIEELQRSIQLRTIQNQNQIEEQEKRFENKINEIINQFAEQRLNDNEKLEKSIGEIYEKFEDEVKFIEEKNQEQNSMIQNHNNKFEQLINQLESIKEEISKNKNELNEFESNLNAQLENIKQTLEKEQLTFITKDISIYIFFIKFFLIFVLISFQKIILSNFNLFYFNHISI